MFWTVRRREREELLPPAATGASGIEQIAAAGTVESPIAGEVKLGSALPCDRATTRQAQQRQATGRGALLNTAALGALDEVFLRAAILHVRKAIDLAPRATLVPAEWRGRDGTRTNSDSWKWPKPWLRNAIWLSPVVCVLHPSGALDRSPPKGTAVAATAHGPRRARGPRGSVLGVHSSLCSSPPRGFRETRTPRSLAASVDSRRPPPGPVRLSLATRSTPIGRVSRSVPQRCEDERRTSHSRAHAQLPRSLPELTAATARSSEKEQRAVR